MFSRIDGHETDRESFLIRVNGQSLKAYAGDSLAATLLANPVLLKKIDDEGGNALTPYCLMGSCYGCLVSLNGKTVQACMITVVDGMIVEVVGKVIDVSNSEWADD